MHCTWMLYNALIPDIYRLTWLHMNLNYCLTLNIHLCKHGSSSHAQFMCTQWNIYDSMPSPFFQQKYSVQTLLCSLFLHPVDWMLPKILIRLVRLHHFIKKVLHYMIFCCCSKLFNLIPVSDLLTTMYM